MPADYLMLQRRAQRRLRVAEVKLTSLHVQWQNELVQCRALADEIALLRQLDDLEVTPGTTLDRGQLFSCLRRAAINRQRHQDLCLQLRVLEQDARHHEHAWQVQQLHCKRLQVRLDNRTQLLRQHRRQQEVRRLDDEETELEERKSWNR